MRRVLLIAQRDYLQVVRSKGFLFGLILLPLLIGGGIFTTSLLNRTGPKEQRVAIVDRTGVAAAAVERRPMPMLRRRERDRLRSPRPI